MAYLTAHLIQGKKVAIEVAIPAAITQPFLIENTVSDGYANISSVENWWKYGKNLGKDYLFVRKEIKKLIGQKAIDTSLSTLADPPLSPAIGDRHYVSSPATGDWTGYEGFIAEWDGSSWVIEPTSHVGYRLLNTNEKLIAAGYKIGGQSDHFADYGVPDIVEYGLSYHRQSIDARKERMLRASVEVYNRLPANYAEVLRDLEGSPIGSLIRNYEEWGIKGILEDYNKDFNPTPTPGIIDYVLARTPFDGSTVYTDAGYATGLKLKSFSPIDAANLDEFCNNLYEILVNGNIV